MPIPAIEHTDHELEIQSTDTENYPYIKERGSLYWNGSAWAKWGGTIGIDQTTDGTTNKVYVGNIPVPVMTTVEFGTLSVTNAGTAQIGTIPSVPYELTVCNASDTDMYWSYKTSTTASNGILLPKTSGVVSFIFPASKSAFFYCASTKNLNWTTRTIT